MGQQYMKSFGRKVTRFILCPFTAFSCQQLATALIYSPHRLKQIVIDLGEKKKASQNMAVGRRQGLMADIPFLTFWQPPRRIYQILVHFSRSYCFSVVCKKL